MRLYQWGILAIALITTSCAGGGEKNQTIRRVKSEVVANIEHTTHSSAYPGKVYAAKEVNRAFRVAGVIEDIVVSEGDYVAEGATIATMDRRDYALQLAATEAEYTAIKGEVERIITLYNEQSVTANDYDKAVNGLKQIEAKLESHRNALADTELKAPFAGYIQKIYFKRGATLSAGMPVISIISASMPEVVINIPSNEYIKRDQLVGATATSELYTNTTFELDHIGTTHKANLNQLYEARFRLLPTEDGESLSAGMSVMVTLDYGDMQMGVVSLPLSAVVERDAESMVWILEEGVAKARRVVVDKVLKGGRVVISSGVKAGEQVITAGVRSLKEGDRVEPLDKKSDSNIGNIL